MDYKQVTELIKLVSKSDISEFKIKEGDFKLTIRTNAYSQTTAVSTAPIQPAAIMPSTIFQAPQLVASAPAASEVVAAETTATTASEAAPKTSSSKVIKSPMVGTFYRSPGPDKEAFVKVGDKISKGQVICIIEAMKLFNEIEAEFDGVVSRILLDDASPVEFDQSLFEIE